jgi:hypothetical protein
MKKPSKRNPIAKALRSPHLRPKVKPSKKLKLAQRLRRLRIDPELGGWR